MSQVTQSQFYANLKKYYSFYTGGFIAFVMSAIAMGVASLFL